MIGSIRGLLLERFSEAEKGDVLVETAGIGYRIIVTPTTAVKIGEKGSEVFVYTYHLGYIYFLLRENPQKNNYIFLE